MDEDCDDRVTYVHTDFTQHQWSESFDIVLCIGVLAHVESLTEALRSLADSVRPGGKCVIHITDFDSLLGKIWHSYGYVRRTLPGAPVYAPNVMTSKQIVEMGARQGLKLEQQRRYSVLLPGMRYLPYKWMHWLQMRSLDNGALSRCGSDLFLIFTKEHTRCAAPTTARHVA